MTAGEQAAAKAVSDYRSGKVPPAAAEFAREVVARAGPATPARTRALLFATSRLAAFGLSRGAELTPQVLLDPYFIDRFLLVGTNGFKPSTVRTLRTNLAAVAGKVLPATGPPRFAAARQKAKAPYSPGEIDAYLRHCQAQPTALRRCRSSCLVALGAGAGLIGGELRHIRGTDVHSRSGGVVVEVGGARARVVPVLERYHRFVLDAAEAAGAGYIFSGDEPCRRNVTNVVTAKMWGHTDLERLDTGRLRATWLAECAGRTGLAAFMAPPGSPAASASATSWRGWTRRARLLS
ncbi:MAG TPA: hypothetical protein VED63_09495 [Acidimicrobiales bacterium]|nr:hypothetical protein [Acidimicrobiales bacterium]